MSEFIFSDEDIVWGEYNFLRFILNTLGYVSKHIEQNFC